MNKQLVLWLSATALLGLSACSYDNLTDKVCVDDTTRCSTSGKLESCQGNMWVSSDCSEGQVCSTEKGVCEDIICKEGARDCNEAKNAVMTCVDNKLNETACTGETQICEAGQCVACINDSKRCNEHAVEHCVDNVWTIETACGSETCNPTTYVCENVEGCTAGWERCNGNVVEVCGADLKYTESETCTAYCIENADLRKAHCVECTEDKPCLDKNRRCDTTTNRCIAPSSISWCLSSDFEIKDKSATGRVLDSRSPKDHTSITANFLCGKAGQKLSEYQTITGSYKKTQDAYFHYDANFSALASGQYLCMWSFALDGEEAVACETGNAANVVSDFSTIPKATEAHELVIAWDHIIDFENFKTASEDDNTETITKDGIETSIVGAIINSGDGSIDKNTLVFADNKDGSVTIKILSENTYIDKLSFEYKRWGHNGFNDVQRLRVYTDDDAEAIYGLSLSGIIETTETMTIPINRKVQSFRIEKKGTGSDYFPRLLIDNISWTNHK